MQNHDWKRPWLNLARFLKLIAAHTVAAVILMALLGLGQYALDHLAAAEDTIWLRGTSHQFAAADLFHASDFAILFYLSVSVFFMGSRS